MEDRCPMSKQGGGFALSLDSINGTIHSSFLSQSLPPLPLVSVAWPRQILGWEGGTEHGGIYHGPETKIKLGEQHFVGRVRALLQDAPRSNLPDLRPTINLSIALEYGFFAAVGALPLASDL